ncbi:unnamed protein product [Adineta steineri]|uniref:Uncharacterized protein n=1 Tax=Adineta steineri TaxID=433720 RepID=A0A815VU64_9BILA|nr:unnamed protein product [Adineta steineri]CAF1533306.1 unnamed protein product [Adineta steineri]
METNNNVDDIPTAEQVKNLLEYLDILYPGGKPILPEYNSPTGSTFYEDEVYKFITLLTTDGWKTVYNAIETHRIMRDPEKIRNATWHEIKSIFSSCRYGERICTGFFGGAIKSGLIQRVLLRVKELAQQ